MECDNGKSLADDGCSDDCKIQDGWVCSGGDENNPDTCQNTISPTCELSSLSTDLLATVKCSERVKLGVISDEDFTVKLFGPREPYNLVGEIKDWKTGSIVTEFKIQFTLSTSILGSGKEIFRITFENHKILWNEYGRFLGNDITELKSTFYKEVISKEDEATVLAFSSFSWLSLVAQFAMSTGLSFISGSHLESTWMLLNTLQLMILLPLLSVDIGTIYREFSYKLLAVNGEPKWLPNIFKIMFGDLELNARNDNYEKLNF